MFRTLLQVPLWIAAVGLSSLAGAADIPEQFKAWGDTGGGQAPLPAGWTEAPPASDDLAAPEGWPAAADAARGFALFSRNPVDPIYPGSYPRRDDLTELRAFTYLGQYVPLTLGVRAIKELKNVSLTMGGLTGAGGELEASQFDVRVVRCHRLPGKAAKTFYWLPTSLEKPAQADIAENSTLAFWVTAYVASTVKPGEYKGRATLKSGETALAEVPVHLKVLPLRLKRPPQRYIMWDGDPIDNEEIYFKYARDQWEHGMNASWPSLQGEVGKRDPANKTRAIPAEQLVPMKARSERRADLWKRTDFGKFPRASYGSPNTNWVLWSWDQQKGWSSQWPLNEHLDANLITAVKMLEEVRKDKGLPECLYYLYDEAGGHPESFPFALHYYKLLKSKLPELRTMTTIGGGLAMGIDEITQLAPVCDVLVSNRISEKIIRDIRGHKREFGVYNGGTAVTGIAAKDRLFFGFFGWKATAESIGQWCYLRGKVATSHVRNADDHGYVSPSATGPVPTIHWEAIRAGVDDMRYIVTLYDLLQQAKKSANAGAQQEAAAAEAALAEIEALLPIPKEEVGGLAAPAFTLSPRVYEKWRWRLAQHILKLHELMGLGEGTEGEVSFPPREFKYSAAAAGPKLSDTELLANTDFENGIEPWSAQKWSGMGAGGLDAEARGGKASVQLTNSTGAQDIVVCVTYPTTEFKAGKTYRFSGWVKTERVEMGVKLRFGNVESNAASGTANWKQLSCDFSPKKDEKVKYLAVWLQGPGKVWIDDLSVREVLIERTPLSISTDADRYDESDGAARVTLRVNLPAEKAGSATVALRVAAGGKEAYSTSVPARQGDVVTSLPLAKLPQGAFDLIAELKDGDGAVLGQATTRFNKTAGPFP